MLLLLLVLQCNMHSAGRQEFGCYCYNVFSRQEFGSYCYNVFSRQAQVTVLALLLLQCVQQADRSYSVTLTISGRQEFGCYCYNVFSWQAGVRMLLLQCIQQAGRSYVVTVALLTIYTAGRQPVHPCTRNKLPVPYSLPHSPSIQSQNSVCIAQLILQLLLLLVTNSSATLYITYVIVCVVGGGGGGWRA